MIISEKFDKILPKLLELKKKLGVVNKNAKNPHFRSTYADLPSLLEEVEPKAQELGLILSQASVFKHEKLFIESRVTDAESGQFVVSEWPVTAEKNTAQAEGSAGTYARRFSLKGLLALREEDDDGNAASAPTSPKSKASSTEPKPATSGFGAQTPSSDAPKPAPRKGSFGSKS